MKDADEPESSSALAFMEEPSEPSTRTLQIISNKLDLISVAACEDVMGAAGIGAAGIGTAVMGAAVTGVAVMGAAVTGVAVMGAAVTGVAVAGAAVTGAAGS